MIRHVTPYQVLPNRCEEKLDTLVQERTKALAERTEQLETLSTKLSKYLAPQVYASIFQGRQQVEIASNRKKLTVFFSRHRGFHRDH